MIDNKGEIVIYTTKKGNTALDVKLEQDTVWLTQKQISQLFKKGLPTINEHIKNIYKEHELTTDSTVRKFRIVQKEGDRLIEREVEFYNLDVIISVGYRVKSKEGTLFRIWATNILKNHLVLGVTIYEKRIEEVLKNWEEHKAKYDHVRFFLERFIGQVARKDVQDKIIEEMETIKKELVNAKNEIKASNEGKRCQAPSFALSFAKATGDK